MKIFITGASGFIGSHLIERLRQTDHDLFCLVRRTSSIRNLEDAGVQLIWGDLREKDTLYAGMSGCDYVIHLAGAHTFWEPDSHVYSDINAGGTKNVMECALETGIKKVIHLSDIAVYGKPSTIPFNEDSVVGPRRFSEYARSKYEGDLISWGLFNKKGLPLIVLYPGVVLGRGNNRPSGDMIRRLVKHRLPAKAFMDSIHTFVHVRDLVEAIAICTEKKNIIGEHFIIGTHHVSIRELMEMIGSISDAVLPGFTLPDPMVLMLSKILTQIADIIKYPPPMQLSYDLMVTLKEGSVADGTKAQQELGITYSSIRDALSEEINAPSLDEKLYDRRKAKRMQVDMSVAYRSEGQDHEESARLNNISEGGIFLETDKPLDKGRYVSANLFGENVGQFIYVRGKVLRKTSKGMAIEITHSDQDISRIFSG